MLLSQGRAPMIGRRLAVRARASRAIQSSCVSSFSTVQSRWRSTAGLSIRTGPSEVSSTQSLLITSSNALYALDAHHALNSCHCMKSFNDITQLIRPFSTRYPAGSVPGHHPPALRRDRLPPRRPSRRRRPVSHPQRRRHGLLARRPGDHTDLL